jgi:hypothetical protein
VPQKDENVLVYEMLYVGRMPEEFAVPDVKESDLQFCFDVGRNSNLPIAVDPQLNAHIAYSESPNKLYVNISNEKYMRDYEIMRRVTIEESPGQISEFSLDYYSNIY